MSCVIHHFIFTIYNHTDQQVVKLDKKIVIFVGKLHNTLNVSRKLVPNKGSEI